MKALLLAACLLMSLVAWSAETVTVVVGHQCCGGCANALIAGAKKTAWVDAVAINGTTAAITAKADQPVEFISLFDAMTKAGFPPNDVQVSAPVTLSIAHLCCGGCVNALKAALTGSIAANLDTKNVTIDATAHTATMQPIAGQRVNLAQVLRDMQRGGFAATKAVFAAK
jgi:copper chaperone CopZ